MSITLLNTANLLRMTNSLSQISAQLAKSNYRLTTGRRVNTAADDPTGVITEARLASDIAQIDGVISNANRIGSIAETADGAISEMSTLLAGIQTSIVSAAGSGVTAEERAAYQAEIDLAVEALDRLVSTTAYNGTTLLDGDIDYDTSNVDSNDITDVHVTSANTDSGSLSVTASVTAAEQAVLTYSGAQPYANSQLRITGPTGTATVTLPGTTSKAVFRDTINTVSAQTGITATSSANGFYVYLQSDTYGDDSSISVEILVGPPDLFDGGLTSDTGLDAIVTVNGVSATVNDQAVTFTSNGTGSAAGTFTLTDTLNQNGGSTSFTISGGAGYRLDNTASGNVTFGQSSLDSSTLGSGAVGYLSSLVSGGANQLSTGNYETAGDIATLATSQVSTAAARWGSLKTYTVDSMVNSLTAAKTAMTTAKDEIVGLDYVTEMAENTRLQILMEIGTSLLGTMNSNATSILSLLTLST